MLSWCVLPFCCDHLSQVIFKGLLNNYQSVICHDLQKKSIHSNLFIPTENLKNDFLSLGRSARPGQASTLSITHCLLQIKQTGGYSGRLVDILTQ